MAAASVTARERSRTVKCLAQLSTCFIDALQNQFLILLTLFRHVSLQSNGISACNDHCTSRASGAFLACANCGIVIDNASKPALACALSELCKTEATLPPKSHLSLSSGPC